jgi:neurofibromin 1
MTPAVDRTYYDEAIQKLEAFFLVSLCSVDITICQTVTECIAVLCEECDQIEGQGVERGISPAFYRNVDIYKQLSSRNFRFTGIVAFQKRVRSLLQRLTFPNSSILKAWDVVFVRWLGLSRRMASLRQTDVVEDVVVNDWRNCSGLLASLAGVCVSTQALLNEDADVTGLRWIDRTTKDNEDETYLDRFLIQCVQLLASSNVRIREAIREVLSSELSAGLHLSLFKHLETELEELFETVATPNSRYIESKLVFTEQAISLLRTIVEKMGNPSDIGSSQFVDIGSLTLNFSTFVNSFPEGPQMLRIKIRLCQLCESITQKKELLNLRHDTRVRNQLLEILFNWIARPGSSRNDTGTSASEKLHNTEMAKLQKDLDRACLKALSDLTFRLPLQPPEGQTDADTSDLKSQMFHTYFNRFLSLISYGTVDARDTDTMSKSPAQLNTQSTENLAIVALSNLLSANIDVGLKHSLGIGYHEDVEIRAAFVTVLCNVLAQGTEFNNLSNVVVNEKYDRLIEVLTDDFDLTIALCDACPSTEVDEVTMALLNIFESRGLGFVLLEHLIKHEISETENEAELLRRNCVTTKMLSIYARWRGSAYLKTTLQKVLQRLVVTAQDLDLELDPARTASPEELQRNILQLRVVTKVFIDDICDSAEYIPVSFRKICSIVSRFNRHHRPKLIWGEDFVISVGPVSRRQVHRCWGFHILALLLPSDCGS